jgi:tetratricopeptide (TPR) repeat protein
MTPPMIPVTNTAKQWIPLALVGIGLCIGIVATQISMDSARAGVPKLQHMSYLPDGNILKVAALGYRAVVADVLWLQVIQAMGDRRVSTETGQWIYRALDVVTTLDPTFVRAYEAGGHALCSIVVMPQESNRLLEKGIRHNPQEWRLPFLLGINHYFEFGDNQKAAEAMAMAARIPGAPEISARLAAKLLVSTKSPQQAVELLAKVYEETSDDNVKKLLEQRLRETIVERDLVMLEEAIRQFQARYSQRPDRLEQLVQEGLLRELPQEPFGGKYHYNAETGEVRSSEVKERMSMTFRKRAQQP